MLRNKALFYFGFLWFGILSSWVYGAILILTEGEITNNIALLLVMLVLCAISGFAYLTILLEAWRRYNFRILLFVFFYPFPKLFAISTTLAVVVFLYCRALETYKAGFFESE